MEKLTTFFDQDFIKNLVSALIGTGTALIVFYLTIRNDKKKERKLDKEQNKQRLNNFSNLLQSAKKQIESFEKVLQQQIDNFSKDQIEFPQLTYNPDYSIERLKVLIQDENYFFAFTKIHKNKIAEYNEIGILIDYFIEQEKQVVEMTNRDSETVFKLKKEFSETVYSLFHYKVYSLTFRKDLLNKNYIDKLNDIYNEFYKNLKSQDEMNYYSSDFFKPVLEQVLNKNVANLEILELTHECKKAIILIERIKRQNKTHKGEMEYILSNYKNRVNLFNKAIKELI